MEYWWASRNGLSARAIGRRFGRDHHTVLRALEPDRVAGMAERLALAGRECEALELATQLGDPALLAWVEEMLGVVTCLRDRQLHDVEMALEAR